MNDTLTMMRELTEAPGVPGHESAVRRLMHRYLDPLGEVITDNLGSIVARKEGQAGGLVLLYDATMIPSSRARDLVVDVAQAEQIPLRFDKIPDGGTDAAKMHIFGAGVPSLVVGVAVRYIHTHAAILHCDDFDQAAQLLVALIKRLDAATVRELTLQE